MNDLFAHPLPDAITEKDLHFFHELAGLAANGSTLNDLLALLQTHLGVPMLAFCPVNQPSLPGDRLVVMPLERGKQHIGDLCLELPPQADSLRIASRLSFFAPLFSLVVEDYTLDLLRAAHNERDRLEAVLESTTHAVLMVDTDDIVALITLQFETFMGIPRYEILGDRASQLADRMQRQDGLPPQLINLLRTSAGSYTESAGGQFEVTAPQHRILVWYSLPVYAQSGALLGRVFIFRDTTRERELDRMRIEFISLISHELRTPLTSVKGFSDLILENEASLDDETREYLQIISQNADRLIRLFNDILDITRIETDRVELKPEFCPLGKVIQQVAASLQLQLEERGHTLRLEIEPRLPPVWADHARMNQIVTNLLSNAIKYTLEPGQITVRAAALQPSDPIPPGAGRDLILPCVLVSVRDTGIGISAEDQAHLFERFYRAKNEASWLVGGTGLGLPIVKSFVEMHGGQVWFETAPGAGSTFFFTVPVVGSPF